MICVLFCASILPTQPHASPPFEAQLSGVQTKKQLRVAHVKSRSKKSRNPGKERVIKSSHRRQIQIKRDHARKTKELAEAINDPKTSAEERKALHRKLAIEKKRRDQSIQRIGKSKQAKLKAIDKQERISREAKRKKAKAKKMPVGTGHPRKKQPPRSNNKTQTPSSPPCPVSASQDSDNEDTPFDTDIPEDAVSVIQPEDHDQVAIQGAANNAEDYEDYEE